MQVSSSTQQTTSSPEVEALKKANDVQTQQVSKIIEDAAEQAKQVNAQKSGLGLNLNISA